MAGIGGKTKGTWTKGDERARASALRRWQWQRAFEQALTAKDVKDIVKKLRDLAKDGNVKAAQYLLDRGLGKPEQSVTVTQEPLIDPDELKAQLIEE